MFRALFHIRPFFWMILLIMFVLTVIGSQSGCTHRPTDVNAEKKARQESARIMNHMTAGGDDGATWASKNPPRPNTKPVPARSY